MGKFIHSTFTIPYKGKTEERKIKIFSTKKSLTKDELEVELREVIGEKEIKIINFETFPENYNFHANSTETDSQGH